MHALTAASLENKENTKPVIKDILKSKGKLSLAAARLLTAKPDNKDSKNEKATLPAQAKPRSQTTFLTNPYSDQKSINGLKEHFSELARLQNQNMLLEKEEKEFMAEYEHLVCNHEGAKTELQQIKTALSYANYLKIIVGLGNLCSRLAAHTNQLRLISAAYEKCLAGIGSLLINEQSRSKLPEFNADLSIIKSGIATLEGRLGIIQKSLVAVMNTHYRTLVLENPTFKESIKHPLLKLLDEKELDYVKHWCGVWTKAHKSKQPFTVELIYQANQAVEAEGFEPELIKWETYLPAPISSLLSTPLR